VSGRIGAGPDSVCPEFAVFCFLAWALLDSHYCGVVLAARKREAATTAAANLQREIMTNSRKFARLQVVFAMGSIILMIVQVRCAGRGTRFSVASTVLRPRARPVFHVLCIVIV
jgi:hypothetical protein